MAEVRCLGWVEIRPKLRTIFLDEGAEELIFRLGEIALTDDEANELAGEVEALSREVELLPSRERSRADRKLLRVARALPKRMLYLHALEDLGHSRKLRRLGAYRALRDVGVSAEIAPFLITRFEETGDLEVLTLIARCPEAVCAVDVTYLLTHLDEDYWRARVIEGLLRKQDDRAKKTLDAFPREFAHAVGRCRETNWIPVLRAMISAEDVVVLGTITWALGVLGDRQGLVTVREIVKNESRRFKGLRSKKSGRHVG
jgi:hypothetical protein